MNEIRLLGVKPGAAPPAPTTIPAIIVFPDGEPSIEEVFILVYWDERSDSIVAVHRTLETAQAAYLEEAYPKEGPRGGKRGAQPEITWSTSPHAPEQWEPSDHREGTCTGHYIERWEVRP